MPQIPDISRRARHPDYRRLAKDVQPEREGRMFGDFIRGMSIGQLAQENRMVPTEVRYVIQRRLRTLYKAERKWKAAEDKCRELTIENRQYQLRYEMADKRNFSHIGMPMRFRKWFERAGVTTIGRLRAVDSDDLLKLPNFPSAAIVWAILELDRRNLSHHLKAMPKGKVRWRRITVKDDVTTASGSSPA